MLMKTLAQRRRPRPTSLGHLIGTAAGYLRPGLPVEHLPSRDEVRR